MREPPVQVAHDELLALVRREWDDGVDELAHLPIGFGAHHWAGSSGGHRRLFVTFDGLLPKRNAEELEAAYNAAAALAAIGLDFVLAGRRSASGSYTLLLADGAVSATTWVEGRTGDGPPADGTEAAECAAVLAQLHATPAPEGTPPWNPILDPLRFTDDLTRRVAGRWDVGPYAEPARKMLRERLEQIGAWTTSYDELTRRALAARDTWVPTHGEPDTGNQLLTSTGRLLVDWESLKLAPRERDLGTLVAAGFAWEAAYGIAEPDWQMVEMFDLEWRLSEIVEYSAWFSSPHFGSASDLVAFEGLREALHRDEWARR